MNLNKRNLSVSFWGRNIPRFDAVSHKSYINLCTFSGAYIKRLNRPSTIKVKTDDGRHKTYLVLDFHIQYIAWLVFYIDLCADDVTKPIKNAPWHHCNTILTTNIHITWCDCSCTMLHSSYVNIQYRPVMYILMARCTHACINHNTDWVLLWDGMDPHSN